MKTISKHFYKYTEKIILDVAITWRNNQTQNKRDLNSIPRFAQNEMNDDPSNSIKLGLEYAFTCASNSHINRKRIKYLYPKKAKNKNTTLKQAQGIYLSKVSTLWQYILLKSFSQILRTFRKIEHILVYADRSQENKNIGATFVVLKIARKYYERIQTTCM